MNPLTCSKPSSAKRSRLATMALLALLPWSFSGCKSGTTSGSSHFAGIIIANHTMDEIRTAAITVFTEHFYHVKVSGPDILVFEKAGSTMDNVLYGDWGPSVTLRVKLYITSASSVSYQVTAQAYMVREAGDTRIEDEQRLTKLRRGPYQKLLEEVKARLTPEPAPQPDQSAS